MKLVTYEHPLNERMRTFLRLEQLMQRLHSAAEGEQTWQSHFALTVLIELMNMMMRVDVKNDLMLELERQGALLARLEEDEGVDTARLENVVLRQRELSRKLHGITGKLAQHLIRNELLATLRQRLNIPGGSCDFDLPAYHYWLSRSPGQRRALLHEWSQPFEIVLEAAEFILGLVREGAEFVSATAERGFFQHALQADAPNQLLRIQMPEASEVFPEISAGKQRFTIRFLEAADGRDKPRQTERNVPFEFATCAL